MTALEQAAQLARKAAEEICHLFAVGHPNDIVHLILRETNLAALMEEKEAWNQCCWEMVHGVMRVTHPMNCDCSDCITYQRFLAIVEKYK